MSNRWYIHAFNIGIESRFAVCWRRFLTSLDYVV
jgi:hypothetical protein